VTRGEVSSGPQVLSQQEGEGWIEQRCRVPRDGAYLSGHFPGYPIVPGAVQVGWALALAGELLGGARRGYAGAPDGERPRLRCVQALKFRQALGPGEEFRLRVERGPEAASLRFRIWNNEDREASSGRLVL
jgi:3-hydroxymyristoyl/3-hydroxydecanoyl-(acyl carrier protein) dehydratase